MIYSKFCENKEKQKSSKDFKILIFDTNGTVGHVRNQYSNKLINILSKSIERGAF